MEDSTTRNDPLVASLNSNSTSNAYQESEKSSLLPSRNESYSRLQNPNSETASKEDFPNTVEIDRSLYLQNTTSVYLCVLKNSLQTSQRTHKYTLMITASLMHVIKGNLGIGTLSLPFAMMNAGIVVGPVLLVIVAVVSIHCMRLLVQCSHVQSDRTKSMYHTYSDVAETCIGQYYPRKSYIGRLTVNTFLVISMLGFCCIYFLFVAETLKQTFQGHLDLDVKIWVAIILLPVLLLSYIRTLRVMAIMSTISNVLYVIGTICLLVYAGRTIKDPKDLPLFAGWRTLPLTFGSVVFTFEGIGVILPVENMMALPRYFYLVLNVGMVIVTLIYLLMSVLGYLSCGTQCLGSFTLNLPNTAYYTAIKLVFASSVLLTYFIQFYVPMSIIIPAIQNKIPQKYTTLVDYGIRTLAVLLTAGLAVGIPQLGDLISLVGAVGSTSLALILPAAIHILTFHHDNTLSRLVFGKDMLIIIFGILGAAAALFATIVDIVKNFQK